MAIRFLLCLILVAPAGCASYVSHSVRIKGSLAEGHFEAALKEVEEAANRSSRLLTLYESGLILHYAQEYENSNLQLHEAERLYDDLFTKSISQEVGAFVTSDVIVDYRGERFESAFIHYYKILNFLHLGDGEGAVVECRKLNHKLKVFRDAGGTFYVDDPFLQYLTGLVYESEGELGDAWVSYRLALEAYETLGEDFRVRVPLTLRCDFERVGSRLGYRDEFPETEGPDPCPNLDANADGGSVLLLVETGFTPHKIEVELVAPIFEDDIRDDLDKDEFALTLAGRVRRDRIHAGAVSHWLKIAFPEIVAEQTPIDDVEVVAVEIPRSAARAAPVADIEEIALRRFGEKRPRMLAKTLARALAKYLAEDKVEEKHGKLAGLAANIFNVATETADTRSWSTLPGRIYVARLWLPAGTYTLQVVLRDRAGQRLDTIAIPGVEVARGRTRFLNHRAF